MASPAPPRFTRVGSSNIGRPAWVARYASLPELRAAIDTLESAGIDGDDLVVVAPADRSPADSPALARTVLGLTAGVVVGALVGAVVGVCVIALARWSWRDFDVSSWGLALLTVWCAVGGAALGWFAAIGRIVGLSRERTLWLAVFDDVGEPSELASRTHAVDVLTDPAPLLPAR